MKTNDTAPLPRTVFLTGGTGYMGTRLAARLIGRGHDVRALVRAGSERKLPPGCRAVSGDALESASYAGQIPPADTLVHLVGVPHPAPWKARQFRAVDLASTRAAVAAAKASGVQHFVYVSVAQPAPVMKAFVQVRADCEAHIRTSGLSATILRPWYVTGPGHRWPLCLVPIYRLLEHLPATRETAFRLGLITVGEMTAALLESVENPCRGVRVWDVARIRAAGSFDHPR